MDALVAVGVGHRLTSGTWDFVPLVAATGLVLVAHVWIGLRLSIPVVAAALVGGLLLSDATQRWGVPAIVLVTVLTSWAAARIVRERRSHHPDRPV